MYLEPDFDCLILLSNCILSFKILPSLIVGLSLISGIFIKVFSINIASKYEKKSGGDADLARIKKKKKKISFTKSRFD